MSRQLSKHQTAQMALLAITEKRGVKLWQATAAEVTRAASTSGQTPIEIVSAAWEKVQFTPAESVTLLTLFFDRAAKSGRIVELELSLLDSLESQCEDFWTPSTDMMQKTMDEAFVDSFTNARAALNALDTTSPVWPENTPWKVRWHLKDVGSPSLEGSSLGGALALGVIVLLRQTGKLATRHRKFGSAGEITPQWLRESAVTAEIESNGNFKVVDAETLSEKLRAAESLRCVFTPSPPSYAAASKPRMAKPRVVDVADLADLLGIIRGMNTRTAASHKWIWLSITLIVLCVVYLYHNHIQQNALAFANPEASALQERLRGFCLVEEISKFPDNSLAQHPRLPAGVDLIVTLHQPSASIWEQEVLPRLEKVERPYVLRITGEPDTGQIPDGFELTKLNRLPGLHGLELIRGAPIRDIRSIMQSPNLRRLVVVGAPVEDLSWINSVRTLEQLCLDSGWIQRMPHFLDLPQLDSFYAHYPQKSLNAQSAEFSSAGWQGWRVDVEVACSRLRRLWLAGDDIEAIHLSREMASLEELTLLLPNFDAYYSELDYQPTKLVKLDLRGEKLTELAWGRHPALKRMKVYSPKLERVSFLPKHLMTLDLSGSPISEFTSLSSMIELRHCFLDGAKMAHLPDVSELNHLNWLSWQNSECREWPTFSTQTETRMLISGTLLGKAVPAINRSAGAPFCVTWYRQLPPNVKGFQQYCGGWLADRLCESRYFASSTDVIAKVVPKGWEHYSDNHPQSISYWGDTGWGSSGSAGSAVIPTVPTGQSVIYPEKPEEPFSLSTGNRGSDRKDPLEYLLLPEDHYPKRGQLKITDGQATESAASTQEIIIPLHNGWSRGIVGPHTEGTGWLDALPERDVTDAMREEQAW